MSAEIIPQALAVILWPLAVLAVCAVVGIALRVWLDRALARIAPGRAVPWDGVGPERECLVRIHHGSWSEWVHLMWLPAIDRGGGWDRARCYRAADESLEMRWSSGGGQYLPDADYVVTHYADLPEVTP